MKLLLKLTLAIAFAFVFSSLSASEASAQITLMGTVPASPQPIVVMQQNTGPATSGPVKFKFVAPTPSSVTGVPYSLGFCIGPAVNPCGSATSYFVSVPGSQARLAIVDASIFSSNVLAVENPTSVTVQFTVVME